MDETNVKGVLNILRTSPQSTMTPSFTYSVRVEGRTSALPEVTDLADFAGIRGKAITDIAIRASSGTVTYRVHVLGGGWLPAVTGCSWSDSRNGYAGNGKPIDLVEVIHSECTPRYHVSPIGKDYLSWQEGNKTGGDFHGCSGTVGQRIDRFQITGGDSSENLGQKIADLARSKCGCPYVYGANGPNQFDCSGLVMWCHQQVGITIPRTSSTQAAHAAKAVISRWNELQAGDVVFFSMDCKGAVDHCAISLGGTSFVHAPQPGQSVTQVSANSWWLQNGRFKYGKRFW